MRTNRMNRARSHNPILGPKPAPLKAFQKAHLNRSPFTGTVNARSGGTCGFFHTYRTLGCYIQAPLEWEQIQLGLYAEQSHAHHSIAPHQLVRQLPLPRAQLIEPRTIPEFQQAVTADTHTKALGSRHSFQGIADTPGTQISLRHLREIHLDATARQVTVQQLLPAIVIKLQRLAFSLFAICSILPNYHQKLASHPPTPHL